MRGAMQGAALALVALLAGCNGAGDSAVLRVADQKESLRTLMEASGVLKDAPYRVEWSSFNDSVQVGEALSANAVDTGAMAETAFLTAASAGGALHAVQGIDTSSRGGGIAVLVPKGSPVATVEALRHARIGTTRNSTGHDLVVRLAERQGWPLDQLKLVFLAPAEGKAALASGAIDAWAVWDPFVATAQTADGARIVATAQGLLTGLDAFQVASDKAIADKRPQLEDFLRRLARAERWGVAHPDVYAASWQKKLGLSREAALLTVKRISRTPVALDGEAIARTRPDVERFAAKGLLHRRIDPAHYLDTSFKDTAQ